MLTSVKTARRSSQRYKHVAAYGTSPDATTRRGGTGAAAPTTPQITHNRILFAQSGRIAGRIAGCAADYDMIDGGQRY